MKEHSTTERFPLEPPNGRRGRLGSGIQNRTGNSETRLGLVPLPEEFPNLFLEGPTQESKFEAWADLPQASVPERTPDELEGPEERLTRFTREDRQAEEHQAYNERIQKLRDRRQGFLAIVENPTLSLTIKQQARIEAAKLKKQIEDLLPKNEVRETRAQAQADLLRRLEEKRLELLRTEVDPRIFYALRYEATNKLREVEKKIAALKGLRTSLEKSYAVPGEIIPTATAVRKQILNTDKLHREIPQAEAVKKPTLEQTGNERVSDVQDLYGYYTEAMRLAIDPRAQPEQRQRAKANLVYHASKVQRAVELLPTATELQRKRKADLEQEIQPFVFEIDEQFDWTNPRLLPIYEAIKDCYKAQAEFRKERTPERVDRFKKAVLQLERTFETLKRNLGSSNIEDDQTLLRGLTPEDIVLREAFLSKGKIPTPPAEPYTFTTIEDPSMRFNTVTPLPPKPYFVHGMDISENLKRYDDLIALTAGDVLGVDEHTKRVRRAERHLASLEGMLILFKTQATRESENLLYLRQPKAIGARLDYTLDDIENFRRLKERTSTPELSTESDLDTSPLRSIKLKSEYELRHESIAFRRSRLEEEIQTMETTLRARLGGRLPQEPIPKEQTTSQTFKAFGSRLWSGAKDLWNRAFTKDYTSNTTLEAQYTKKTQELAELDAHSKDPGREIGFSRQLKNKNEKSGEFLKILLEKEASHDEKILAIRHYHESQAFLTSFKATSILDEQMKDALIQNLKRMKRAILEYQQKLKRLNIELVEEISRQNAITSTKPNTERMRSLLTAQETVLAREWSAQMEVQSVGKIRDSHPTKTQLSRLKQAHELEHQLQNRGGTSFDRVSLEDQIKRLYNQAYA